MDPSPSQLSTLFHRYYNGTATAEETDALLAFIRTSKNDENLARLLKDAWENLQDSGIQFSSGQSESILNAIFAADQVHEEETSDDKIHRFPWLRYAAAAVILLAGFGVFWKFKNHRTKEPIAVSKPKNTDIAPGGNRALLTLSDGSTIVLDSAVNGLLARQGSSEVTKKGDGQLVYNSKYQEVEVVVPQVNTLTTPKGGQYQIVLPDGSTVWLNASSSIRFPTVFTGNERKVKITGEVYFDVAKDKARPFTVSFGSSEVEVLGTSFNIKAYTDETSAKTTLIEGSVSLKSSHENQKLKPGQQASVFSDGQIVTRIADLDEAVAWKTGLFYFQDAGIEEVMRQAARWYDIDVVYQGKIPVRQFTGKVSRNVNISELLIMLRYAGVNCRIENKTVIITS